MPPTSSSYSRASRWSSAQVHRAVKASSWRRSTPSCLGTGGSKGRTSLPRRTARCGIVRSSGSARSRGRSTSPPILLAWGSWGANGDHSMWLNDRTAWTWRRLWALEEAFWDLAPKALASAAARPALAQAARELLLAQASDWQFMISTGAVVDYAERRFTQHCDDAERLIKALTGGALEDAGRIADELARRDDLFPNVLAQVAGALGG